MLPPTAELMVLGVKTLSSLASMFLVAAATGDEASSPAATAAAERAAHSLVWLRTTLIGVFIARYRRFRVANLLGPLILRVSPFRVCRLATRNRPSRALS